MLTIPSSPIAMEIHSAHQLPAHVRVCVFLMCSICLLTGEAQSILPWEWDVDSAAGAGNGKCLSRAAMLSSGQAEQ